MVDPVDIKMVAEWTDFLQRVSIFAELEHDALKEVAKKLQLLSLPKGAVLYRQGDAGNALYVIRSGRVKIVRQEEEKGEKILNYLGRGDTFGETALLTGAPRSVTVQVDSPSDFLVLYKKDFETFLKKNPRASFYLSRLISQRLLVASQPSLLPSLRSELLGFFCDLEKDDQILFMLNLSLVLTEQTRRKILLLDLTPYGSELVRSLGLNPILSSSRMFASKDLRNPKILEQLTLIHPSGLEIITLPCETFSGILFRSISSFLETLRNLYDFVVINLMGKADSTMRSYSLNEVTRSILLECDSVFYLFSESANNMELLQLLLQENRKVKNTSTDAFSDFSVKESEKGSSLFSVDFSVANNPKTIFLKKKSLSASISSPIHFVVPWNDQISSSWGRTGDPYLTGSKAEPTHAALGRIARAIGKLQVGLAMGSGSAYGYAIIGILKVFEREKIPIDFISGTSMGSLIGSFYAIGKNAEEIAEIAYSISKIWLRKNFLSDLNLPWLHGGILEGETISQFLRKVLGQVEFKDLKIPFSCTATDIMTGDSLVLHEGKVWEAVRASLSLPLIFSPYKMGNRFLVDGGLVNPIPTSLIASMGADLLISINLTSRVSERKVSLRRLGIFPSQSPGFFSIFFKMIHTMQYQIASTRTDLSQIVIRPDTKNFSWIDFHRARQIIPLGEEAAEESLTKIKAILPFFADSCRLPIRPLPLSRRS